MKYRNLGRSGLKVSVIGLGTNQFGGKVGKEGTREIIHKAVDLGINLFDTADVYKEGRSEEYIGEAIQGIRDRVLIATKFFFKVGEGPNEGGGSRHHIINAVESSLKRLKTDHIDLYQIHRWDKDTPIEETLRALDDLVKTGKIRYIGASNFTAWQMTWAKAIAESNRITEFISIQPHYHMLERKIEEELLPAAKEFGWGVLPYFPLAGGFLTGKYKQDQNPPEGTRGESSPYVQKYFTEENYSILKKLEDFSAERGYSLVDLAHTWLLSNPDVCSVISGASRVEHVVSNTGAVDWELSEEDLSLLTEILT